MALDTFCSLGIDRMKMMIGRIIVLLLKRREAGNGLLLMALGADSIA
jgi:hypothetical protein